MIPFITFSSVVLTFALFLILALLSTPVIFLWHLIMLEKTAHVAWKNTADLHVRNCARAKKIAFFIPRCLMALVGIVIFLFAHAKYVQRLEEKESSGE